MRKFLGKIQSGGLRQLFLPSQYRFHQDDFCIHLRQRCRLIKSKRLLHCYAKIVYM